MKTTSISILFSVILFTRISTLDFTIRHESVIPYDNIPKLINPNEKPFSLALWDLQLPVGENSDMSIIGSGLLETNYTGNNFFYLNPAGDAFVFHTPVFPPNAAISGGSDFTRTELRELDNSGNSTKWDMSQGFHYFGAIYSIQKVSIPENGKLIYFQIHNECCAVVTFRLTSSKGKNLLFASFNTFQAGGETKVMGNVKFTLDEDYKFGTKFKCEMTIENGLSKVYYNGIEKTPTEGYDAKVTSVYFKAGSYSQNLEKEAPKDSINEVWIYNLDVYHGEKEKFVNKIGNALLNAPSSPSSALPSTTSISFALYAISWLMFVNVFIQ